MSMNLNNFTFDVDGTLINSHGELNTGVVSIFNRILDTKEDAHITFVSGNSTANVQKVITKINDKFREADKLYVLHPNIISFAGSAVYRANGSHLSPIEETPLKLDDIQSIYSRVKECDKNAVIFFCTNEGNYYVQPKMASKTRLALAVLNMKENKKGDGGFKASPTNLQTIHSKVKAGEVYSLEILTLNKESNKNLHESLKPIATNSGITLNPGQTIQVSSHSKLQALNTLYQNLTPNMLYVGDSYNDVDCLKFFTPSFAIGKNINALTSANVAIKDFSQIMPFINNDYSKIQEQLVKSEQLIKDVVREKDLEIRKSEQKGLFKNR